MAALLETRALGGLNGIRILRALGAAEARGPSVPECRSGPQVGRPDVARWRPSNGITSHSSVNIPAMAATLTGTTGPLSTKLLTSSTAPLIAIPTECSHSEP